jgi:hypothetical protein
MFGCDSTLFSLDCKIPSGCVSGLSEACVPRDVADGSATLRGELKNKGKVEQELGAPRAG